MNTPLGRPERLQTNELTTFHRNPRKGNVEAIAESLRSNGQYRPIVVNTGSLTGRPMEVLAGNHTLLAARSIGTTELDAYVVDVDDTACNRIVVADNRTADLGTYDDEALLAILQDIEDVEGTGYTEDEVEALAAVGEESETYTRDVSIPLYEPRRDTPPSIAEIVDTTRTDELTAAIEDAEGIPDEVKRFLTVCAQRHTVIDFGEVAEYYAHADPTVQQLMEDQALVIIDLDDAIRGGYAALQEDIETQRLADAETGPAK